MQLGPISITFAEPKDKEKDKPLESVSTAELGGSGTTLYDGIVSDEEFNPKLDTEYGQGGLDIFNQMRRSDPIVKQSLKIVTLPIIQGSWKIEEAQDEPGSDEHKKFIDEALFKRMDRSFQTILREILTYLPFGFSVFEKVFVIEEGKVYLKKLAMRKQQSIMKFEMSEPAGKFGITQQLNGKDSRQVSIPGDKLAIFTHEKEGDNYRGISILRSAYKPWYFKEVFEKIDAIAFERQGVGVPVFTMPKSPKLGDVTKAETIGKNLRANEKAFVLLPNGWLLEILDMKGKNSVDATDKIKAKNREILSNVLAQFLDLGSGDTGSRSLSSDHSDSFYRAEQSEAEYIAEVFNDQIIPQLIDLNFDNVQNYPKLKVTNIKKFDLAALATALQNLVNAKALTPDAEIEEYLRDLFGLPAMSEELKKKREEDVLNPPDPLALQTGQVDENGKPIPPKVAPVPGKPKPAVDPIQKENPEKPSKPAKKLSEHFKSIEMQEQQIGECGHTFSEEGYYREFTEPEIKIDIAVINAVLDKLEAQFAAEVNEIAKAELDQLLASIRMALRSGDMARIEALLSNFKFDLFSTLIRQSREAFEYGKKTVSENLKVPLIPTTQEQTLLIQTRASALAEKIGNDLLSQVKLGATESLQLKLDVDQAMKSIRLQSEKLIERSTDLASSNVMMGSFNQGRKAVQDEYSERIYALQRSEILDKRICNYCLSIDGRVVSVDDPIANTNQFHFKCRGIWVEILLAETSKPEITGIPPDLQERTGLLSDFKQLATAQPLEGSMAEAFVKSGKRVALK